MTTDSETAHLVIEDDGVGIEAARADPDTGIRDGIGIQLIRGFARQLGASLTVQERNGTRYTVEIPLGRERPTGEEPAHEEAEAPALTR
jgi:two-component sensor histidine kinase